MKREGTFEESFIKLTERMIARKYSPEAEEAGYVEVIAQCLASIADSLERKTKTGHWKHNKCDVCGASRPPLFDNYCPNCGADMKGDIAQE